MKRLIALQAAVVAAGIYAPALILTVLSILLVYSVGGRWLFGLPGL